MRFALTDTFRVSRNLNTWDVFWTNKVEMRHSVVGRGRV